MKSNSIHVLFIILASIMVVGFYYFSFYPGYMSFDSAKQYSQVLSGEWDTISPIVMVLLWTITENIIHGPGGLFILFLLIFTSGLLLFAFNLKLNLWLRLLVVCIIAMWPFNLMILPHLWKDVGLMAFLSLGIGLIQLYKNTNKYISLLFALIALIIASLFRFESILYITVIDLYAAILLLRHFNQNRITIKAISLSIGVLLVGLLLSQAIIKLSHSKKIILWQSVALWDLSRVSVKVNSILLPPFVIGAAMDVEDLSTAVVPWTNTHLFWKTKAGMNSGLMAPYKNGQYKQLFDAWLSMIVNHPKEYLTHRFEVANDLLRIKESENKPIDLFFSRKMYGNEKEFILNKSFSNQKITHFIVNNKDNVIFKGWIYLLINILIVLYLFFSKRLKNHEFIAILCISGIFSAIALSFVSPSAEQRYLIWLINSTLFASILLISNSRPRNHDV